MRDTSFQVLNYRSLVTTLGKSGDAAGVRRCVNDVRKLLLTGGGVGGPGGGAGVPAAAAGGDGSEVLKFYAAAISGADWCGAGGRVWACSWGGVRVLA